jgi:hypothetical protein
MSQSTIHSEINKVICEAVNCYAQATTNIKVKLGNSASAGRTIVLNLCNNCVKKFQEEEDIVL